MVLKYLLTLVAAVFIIGFITGEAYGSYSTATEQPVSFSFLTGRSAERISPSDHILENDVHVFSDRVVLDVDSPFWASFTDTNSMDPVIDAGANSVEASPKSPDEIAVGDIISFRTGLASGTIIHRVIEKGEDDEGAYFITKGDNNPLQDPGKVRFEDIKGVVVAVIY